MRWEQCKRPTRCRDCGKQMVKGETRLMSKVRFDVYISTYYRCQICGAKYLKQISSPEFFQEDLSIEMAKSIRETKEGIEICRTRLLRPIEN